VHPRIGFAAALVTSASAQQGTVQSVTFYTVKPDRIGDFLAEIKEYDALLAKGGSTNYASMWMSLTGPREYVRASYYHTWAELDAGPTRSSRMKPPTSRASTCGSSIAPQAGAASSPRFSPI